ncbi:MAG: hypothetical protein ABFR47_02405 [Verrucomicrobiota bacterium]
MKKLLLIATIGSAIALQTAQATWITASGDTFTIVDDVTFTINASEAFATIINIDNILAPTDLVGSHISISGLTISINGGSAISLEKISNGYTGGDLVSPNDVFMYTTAKGVSAGDTVTLHAGTATVATGFPTLPAVGNYNLFITDNLGNQISDIGVNAIPEPASIGLICVFSGATLFIRRTFMI